MRYQSTKDGLGLNRCRHAGIRMADITREKASVKEAHKPILAVDVDSTLADIYAPLLSLVKKKRADALAEDDLNGLNMDGMSDMQQEQMKQLLGFIWDDPDNIPLVDSDIPKVLKELHKEYEIHIVTATMGDEATVRKWLADKGIPYDKYVHVKLPTDKKNYNADIFIDDDYIVAVGVSAKGKRCLLIRQPWNEALIKLHKPKNVTPIKDWDEAERILLTKLLRR